MDKADQKKEERERVDRQPIASEAELVEAKAKLELMTKELQAAKMEKFESDSAASQLKSKPESVEKKPFILEQGRKHTLAMVSQTAVGDQSLAGRIEVVNSELIEKISNQIGMLSQFVQSEVDILRKGLERSLILTNARTPIPMLSAQVLGALLAQNVLQPTHPAQHGRHAWSHRSSSAICTSPDHYLPHGCD